MWSFMSRMFSLVFFLIACTFKIGGQDIDANYYLLISIVFVLWAMYDKENSK